MGKGNGSVFSKPGSPYLYLQWYQDGKKYQKSAKTTSKREAWKKLREVIDSDVPVNQHETVNRLLDRLLDYYDMNRKPRTAKNVRYQVDAVLRPEFGHLKASQLRRHHIERFIKRRHDEGRANASIKNDLAYFQRAFSLADMSFPKYPKIEIQNARTFVYTDKQFRAVLKALPDYIRPVVVYANYTGSRIREILDLKWKEVDLKNRMVTLNVGETKNKEGRKVALNKYLTSMLSSMKDRAGDSEFVFTRNGQPIKDFRHVWNKAREAVGIPEAWVHDFRRTAISNRSNAGAPQVQILRMSGHKTDSVFRRYNIFNDSDLLDMVDKHAAESDDPLADNLEKFFETEGES